ncbi:MAG TPA: class I adenylate-forming enzyme family protein [Acidimicrobiales bacterium]|nr:class I adenylate-forming enzyme family protein [Acidimicrobiales bacterium]
MAGGLLHHGLEQAAHRFGNRVAIVSGDQTWTFGALEQAAGTFAGHLAARGVTAGSRVAVMSTNRPEFVVAVHAVSKLGASAALLNSAWKALEVDHALELTDPVHAVADGPALDLLREQLGISQVTDLDDAASYRGSGSASAPVTSAGRVGDDVLLVFSSGTTGLPKAVRHTHASIGAAIGHWRDALGLGPDDRFQVATPPSHILGLLNLVTAISAGATVRLHRRFDLDEVLSRVQRERMTLEMAVAPIALAMANHPDLEKYDLSSLRYIMWGATPVTPSVAEVVTSRTGVRWLPAYGASEIPVLAANPVAEPDAWRLDSAGLPVPGIQLRIVGLGGTEPLPPEGVGEIQARSPSVMAGYLPDEANADAFVDGWYRTGDVGWLEPEGWLHITDRSKEMIKVKGFQVAPAELEGVLLGHPAVADCAVFGVAEERSGEVPVAAVQLNAGASATPEELMKLVSEALASYKRLQDVVLVESIPRLPSGKVLRRVLREEWEPVLQAREGAS